MTDIELSRLLSDLEASASKLNAESDSLNAVLESVEAKLVAVNVGLETWLEAGDPLDSRDETEYYDDNNGDGQRTVIVYRTELGFAKVNGSWRLATRVERGEPGKWAGDTDWFHESGPAALLDASRELRIRALPMLPALLKAVTARSESARGAIQEAEKLVK